MLQIEAKEILDAINSLKKDEIDARNFIEFTLFMQGYSAAAQKVTETLTKLLTGKVE